MEWVKETFKHHSSKELCSGAGQGWFSLCIKFFSRMVVPGVVKQFLLKQLGQTQVLKTYELLRGGSLRFRK